MENSVGYIVHYLKKVGEPIISNFNSDITEQKLKIEEKIIPLILKDSFEKFFENSVPTEDDFNHWYSKQNLIDQLKTDIEGNVLHLNKKIEYMKEHTPNHRNIKWFEGQLYSNEKFLSKIEKLR